MPPNAILTTVPTLVAMTDQFAPQALALTISSSLAIVASGLLWRARRNLLGTTLIAAWWWALVAWIALVVAFFAGVLGCQESSQEGWRQAFYFAAVAATLCPGVAVLGAKRPQHVAWQWIVLSLWVVLVLPAGRWLIFDTTPSLHAAQKWFLGTLMVVGVVNYLPTGYWMAAATFGLAQLLLVYPFLDFAAGQTYVGLGFLLVTAAISLASLLALFGRQFTPHIHPPMPTYVPQRDQENELTSLDHLWRDFRDAYGLLWGLRVAERFNAQATANGSPVRLSWRGFSLSAGGVPTGLSAAQRQAATDNLTSWLRRFVDAEWIARRLAAEPAGRVAPPA